MRNTKTYIGILFIIIVVSITYIFNIPKNAERLMDTRATQLEAEATYQAEVLLSKQVEENRPLNNNDMVYIDTTNPYTFTINNITITLYKYMDDAGDTFIKNNNKQYPAYLNCKWINNNQYVGPNDYTLWGTYSFRNIITDVQAFCGTPININNFKDLNYVHER